MFVKVYDKKLAFSQKEKPLRRSGSSELFNWVNTPVFSLANNRIRDENEDKHHYYKDQKDN